MSNQGERTLRIVPLGGLGEFGANTMVYETPDSAIVVDCGMKFPDPSILGVDVVIPDFSYLASIREKVIGIFLTHGHEDHIGAVPFLVEIVDAPVWGGPMALAFMREKFREIQPSREVELNEMEPRRPVTVGPFTVEPIHVTHSIVDACALAIETPAGIVFHTGDFKFDQTPVDGVTTDFARIGEYGERDVRVLVSDSTNALQPGICGSEATVRSTLEGLFDHSEGRIFLTTFASHIHRIQTVVDLAELFGRHVYFIGRSLVQNVAIAEKLGHLRIPRSVRPFSKDIAPDDDEAVIICTGSQGEPASSLARIARDEHRKVSVQTGDTVIISARTIPGNERAVMHVIDHLLRRNVRVVYEEPGIHVSGHGHREELKLMLRLTDPEYFVPMHGSLLHLVRHGEIAAGTGIDRRNIFVITNGQVVEIGSDRGEILDETVPAGKVFVDQEFEEVPSIVVRDRRHLGEDGFVIVVAALSSSTGTLAREMEIITRGVIHVDESQELLDEIRNLLLSQIEQARGDDLRDMENVQEIMRTTLKRFFRKRFGRRPMILPVVWEM
ncbi:MAG: ribonuclease J [Acidobacteria bacterium]|nr:ribonuclease J [Acidobacteriota bacterium]